MARIVEGGEDTFRNNRRPYKYPWGEWADGQKRILTMGEDFDCPVASFVGSVYTHARRTGLRVKAERAGLGNFEVAVQFFRD